ncbi:type IV pilus modification PilV family protein [Paenibacillus camerounensis]|uniref:type IV pilus modification PilV family protein n=1 Tax=Paenibacillus camerounensis TaxID=1243663 RepID=UPI0005A7DA85|nr:type II secretion system protein [Paenibacillus camerounensis]
MKDRLKQEQGFTLIEVLAAIIILSIVSLVLTSYFTNAMSYAKANQNKTIMVNLARNALFYAEKQDFDKWKCYLDSKGNIGYSDVRTVDEPDAPCSYNSLVKDVQVLDKVLNPSINGINYTINIAYQAEIYNKMKDSQDLVKQKSADYLIPVLITVKSPEKNGGNAAQTVVEGYIRNEEIR